MKKKTIFLFSLLILIPIIASTVFAQDPVFVVVNGKDWRAVYLGTIYAKYNDAEFLHFQDLNDAHLKTQMIPKNAKTIILESQNRPVIKNYEAFLKVNGYAEFSTIHYVDYTELQEKLWADVDTNGYILFDGRYGVEAVASAPHVVDKKLAPLFLSDENHESVKSIIGSDKVEAVGRFPVRLMDDINAEGYFGYHPDNVLAITKDYLSTHDDKWGIITLIDRVVPTTLTSEKPIFVYFGEMDVTAQSVKDSGISNFEVISGDIIPVAQDIEALSGRDLKMLMRYGRTLTNVPSLDGKVQDLDTVFFDYPLPDMAILRSEYYPEYNLTTVTFQNTGNIPVLFYTNLEIGGIAASDTDIHYIIPSEVMTIPFDTDGVVDPVNSLVTTQYWYRFPLTKMIESQEGNLFITVPTSMKQSEHISQILLDDYVYNDDLGRLTLFMTNPNTQELKVFAELLYDNETVLSSNLALISGKDKGKLHIDTPYMRWEDIKDRVIRVKIYYGVEDTIFVTDNSIVVEKLENLITGNLGKFVEGSVYILIPLLIAILGVFFIFGKKKKKDKK